MRTNPVRNLVIENGNLIQGTVPPISGRVAQALSSTHGVLVEALLNQDWTHARLLMGDSGISVNAPLRVRAADRDGVTYVWRTPLELAIETDDLTQPTMVEFLINKGAKITKPALQIALMVIDRNLRGLELGHTRAQDPRALFNTLSQAGANWGEAMVDAGTMRWVRIQAHYEAQEAEVARRLDALKVAAGDPPAPGPKPNRIRM